MHTLRLSVSANRVYTNCVSTTSMVSVENGIEAQLAVDQVHNLSARLER